MSSNDVDWESVFNKLMNIRPKNQKSRCILEIPSFNFSSESDDSQSTNLTPTNVTPIGSFKSSIRKTPTVSLKKSIQKTPLIDSNLTPTNVTQIGGFKSPIRKTPTVSSKKSIQRTPLIDSNSINQSSNKRKINDSYIQSSKLKKSRRSSKILPYDARNYVQPNSSRIAFETFIGDSPYNSPCTPNVIKNLDKQASYYGMTKTFIETFQRSAYAVETRRKCSIENLSMLKNSEFMPHSFGDVSKCQSARKSVTLKEIFVPNVSQANEESESSEEESKNINSESSDEEKSESSDEEKSASSEEKSESSDEEKSESSDEEKSESSDEEKSESSGEENYKSSDGKKSEGFDDVAENILHEISQISSDRESESFYVEKSESVENKTNQHNDVKNKNPNNSQAECENAKNEIVKTNQDVDVQEEKSNKSYCEVSEAAENEIIKSVHSLNGKAESSLSENLGNSEDEMIKKVQNENSRNEEVQRPYIESPKNPDNEMSETDPHVDVQDEKPSKSPSGISERSDYEISKSIGDDKSQDEELNTSKSKSCSIHPNSFQDQESDSILKKNESLELESRKTFAEELDEKIPIPGSDDEKISFGSNENGDELDQAESYRDSDEDRNIHIKSVELSLRNPKLTTLIEPVNDSVSDDNNNVNSKESFSPPRTSSFGYESSPELIIRRKPKGFKKPWKIIDDEEEQNIENKGLRRSQRHRSKPLDYWRGQRPIYKYEDIKVYDQVLTLPTLIDHTNGTDLASLNRRKMRKTNRANLKSSSIDNVLNLSVHSKACKKLEDNGSNEFVKKFDELNFKPIGKTKGVELAIMEKSQNGEQVHGMMRLQGYAQKELRRSGSFDSHFTVVFGAIGVKIGSDSIIVKSGSYFKIKSRQEYSMENLRKDPALIQFTIFDKKSNF